MGDKFKRVDASDFSVGFASDRANMVLVEGVTKSFNRVLDLLEELAAQLDGLESAEKPVEKAGK